MKNLIVILIISTVFIACNNAAQKGMFTVDGELENVPNQKVYLEELYFSQQEPVVLDTAEITNGKFTLSGLAPEQGLYRLRLEKNDAAFLFINDQDKIDFTADYNNLAMDKAVFNSPANQSLRKFLMAMDDQRKQLETQAALLEQHPNKNDSDSVYQVLQQEMTKKGDTYKRFVLNYLDTTSNAVMALFALGYTRNVEPEELEKQFAGLAKRFPKNESIAAIVSQYNQMRTQNEAKPGKGDQAPEINMPDTSGKTFALSSLRGKYVLVDFWASWCAPCRGENPNVVKAYNNLKDKNFTVLGVSLDKDKTAWLQAIADDQLTWHHISDLKYWNSAAVSLYGFEGIPYNVLVDPEGKIIASDLRGEQLEATLVGLMNN